MPIKRRKFLGIGISGFAGFTLPRFFQSRAHAAAGNAAAESSRPVQSAKETTYWDRTERFEEKLKLLEAAWQRKDFRMTRALTHSLRSTAVQAQAEEENPGTPLFPASRYQKVESLPSHWRSWAEGWKYCRTLVLDETIGDARADEPVEVLLSFPAEQVHLLTREVRVARVTDGMLKEVPSQVFNEVQRGNERICRLLFMAESRPHQKQTILVFYGNPDAELPEYPTDLLTSGEGFGLDIENQFFKASLSRQMGQLERLTLKREHGLELFSGGEGHGEPPGIDWAHDYVSSGSFQKLRITLWDTCPDY